MSLTEKTTWHRAVLHNKITTSNVFIWRMKTIFWQKGKGQGGEECEMLLFEQWVSLWSSVSGCTSSVVKTSLLFSLTIFVEILTTELIDSQSSITFHGTASLWSTSGFCNYFSILWCLMQLWKVCLTVFSEVVTEMWPKSLNVELITCSWFQGMYLA